jgi:hypothetical protein
MEELLLEHGFRATRKEGEFIKRRYNVKIEEDSIIIVYYKPRVGLVWTETYYNFENFKKYIKKEHKTLVVT